MPRKPKGPRLYLRRRQGRGAVWVILDGREEESTGCSEGDSAGAEEALGAYIARKHKAPKTGGQLSLTLVADVMNLYLTEHAPTTASPGWLAHMASPIIDWWGEHAPTLADANAKNCNKYVDYRVAQGVSDQTARHELTIFGAAITYYHKSENGPLTAVPALTLPAKKPPRDDYWLTRKMAADRIRAARKRKRCAHMIRMMLIGFYSGTRPGAIKKLRWIPSTAGGWFDLETETMYRRGAGTAETRKRAPKARIHQRLLPWLRRWKTADEKWAKETGEKVPTYVVHYYGKPIKRTDSAWASIAGAAGHAADTGRRSKDGCVIWDVPDGPHIMRHTAATWQMQAGTDPYEAAGFLGMSVDTLLDVYGHHHPDYQKGAASAAGKRR
jgi:integrase